MVCVTANVPTNGYICCNFPPDTSHLKYQQNITALFEAIVNIRRGHVPGYHDLHIRFSKWPLAMAHPSNCSRYNRDILYSSVSKVQWCVHGHWIHIQRSYEVNILNTLAFLYNPAGSIYVKNIIMTFLSTVGPSWWQFQIYDLVHNNRIFFPGYISCSDNK